MFQPVQHDAGELDEQGLIAWAERLAPLLQRGDCLLLEGTLGAGKTSFARALIRALTTPEEEVPSPTFTIVQSYDTPGFTLWHYDLYRVGAEAELRELGLDEAFGQGVSLIEWPEVAEGQLPPERLIIRLEVTDDPSLRHLRFEGTPAWNDRFARLLNPA